MTIEEMKAIKRQKGYSYAQIAELTGVPLGTVQKIFCGETQNPRYDTLLALERFFAGESHTYVLRENSPEYGSSKKQGDYTVDDYYALPDERRVELIDGVIYDMSAPTCNHQLIGGEIYRQIANYIRGNKGKCIPMMSPVDVRLDCDNKTMVQPDVLILCDRSKMKRWGIMGAPDFILEVLSPSTKRKDCIKKLEKYREAGVKEYWMIDPYKRKVIIYQFEQEMYPMVCGIEGKIPVGLYEGNFMIDMDIVKEMIADYPEEEDDEEEV
ncbi:MAG: Uma2 family endonuclease [Lachnospiraceae bacterium]|nr:Uma2 family endonuclease [Lachnospiraceae bacterium]